MEEEKLLGERLLQSMEVLGDVTFEVGPPGEEEEVKSSSFLLRSLSLVFEKMFDANWKSQEQVVKLPDIKAKVFRHFLQLLLTDKLNGEHLNTLKLTMDEVVNLLYTANKYDTKSIQTVCRSAIKEMISIKNVVYTYNQLLNMNEPELEKTAFDFMIGNIEDLLDKKSFNDLSKETLAQILNTEELEISELSLFNGIVRWAEFHCGVKYIPCTGENLRDELDNLLFLIRFPAISPVDFFNVVEPMGILTSEEVVSVSRCHVLKRDPKFVNSSPFKKKRGVQIKPLEKMSALSHCFVFHTDVKIVLQRVNVALRTLFDSSGPYSPRYYNIKIVVWDDSSEIWRNVPNVSVSRNTSSPLSIDLEKPLILEPNSTYYIHCEVQENGCNVRAAPTVADGTLSIYY